MRKLQLVCDFAKKSEDDIKQLSFPSSPALVTFVDLRRYLRSAVKEAICGGELTVFAQVAGVVWLQSKAS